MSAAERGLVATGALAGFLGVAVSAIARHAGGTTYLETVAQFLLFHAPALLALAILVAGGLAHRVLGRLAGLALVLGLLLFCGDLAARDLLGGPLFAMAAPTGGILLMVGWALTGSAGLWGSRRSAYELSARRDLR